MDCNSCEARHNCMAVVAPGSIMCAIHLLQAGGTKADKLSFQKQYLEQYQGQH